MKKRLTLLLIFIFLFIPKVHAEQLQVDYQAHVQNIGWQNIVNPGMIAGTTGRSLRMEAIRINIVNHSIRYQSHVQDIGWQDWVGSAEVAGTTGQSKRMEAIKIELNDSLKDSYDIYYRAHVQNVGWMDWVKNGEIAGTTGRGLRMEAFEIKLVQKTNAPSQNNANVQKQAPYANLTYSSYVNGSTWQNYVNNGNTSGTTGQSKWLSAIKFKLDTNIDGNIIYQTYSNYKWNNSVNNNIQTGDLKNPLEAIKIKLTGELSNKYDIYYRVHLSDRGWLDWTKNDSITGSIGYFNRIEAVEAKLLPKNSTEIKTGTNILYKSNNTISYKSHVQDVGWQSDVTNGNVSGTTGLSKRLEAFIINLDSKIGNIECSTYVEKRGWQASVNAGNVCGTTGQSKKLEAIKITLTSNLATYYDIYYRTHISNIGWLDWAKNGEKSGSVGNGTGIESIQIKLVPKGSSAPGATSNKYVTGTWKNNNTNYYNYFGVKVSGFQFIDGTKYFFNSDGDLKGKKVKAVIDVSSYQKTIDWNAIKRDADIDEVILRVGWGMSYDDAAGIDSYFDSYIKSVKSLGIPYSVYIYSYARVKGAAEKEATFVKDMMQKYNIPKSTFVWYDVEQGYTLDTYNTVVPAFVDKMHNFGYPNVGVYGNVSALSSTNGYLNSPKIKQYPIWVAQYYKHLQYSGNYRGWQFSSSATVNGINGRVDLNMFY